MEWVKLASRIATELGFVAVQSLQAEMVTVVAQVCLQRQLWNSFLWNIPFNSGELSYGEKLLSHEMSR